MKALVFLLPLLVLAGCSTHRNYSLMPGQSLYLDNSTYTTFAVRADYPVSIKGENCYLPRAVDARLHCGPANVTITDSRPPLLIWGRANRVTLTASLY